MSRSSPSSHSHQTLTDSKHSLPLSLLALSPPLSISSHLTSPRAHTPHTSTQNWSGSITMPVAGLNRREKHTHTHTLIYSCQHNYERLLKYSCWQMWKHTYTILSPPTNTVHLHTYLSLQSPELSSAERQTTVILYIIPYFTVHCYSIFIVVNTGLDKKTKKTQLLPKVFLLD